MTFFKNVNKDFPAGIVVFLVAVPLCLGIALASGAPLFSGIIAGIVGGILVSLISGSQLGVSGPAAGLAVIVLNSIETLGSFEAFLLAVVLAGAIQVFMGIVKLGIIGYYFPYAVIKGMLAGIGLIIILKQIPHSVGYDVVPEGSLRFIQSDGQNTFSELINILNYLSPGAMLVTMVSLTILILWERPLFKKKKIFKIIQGPLVVVVLGIIYNLFTSGNSVFGLSEYQVVKHPVSSNISEFLGQFTLPDFNAIYNQDIILIAFTIAVVASLETLLCVEATDKLDPHKRVTPTNRELVAQGFGNMASGLIGGLPVTQVIVRSSANIQSGGESKAAAFFHGLLILLSVVLIPHVLNLIPLSSLAAILIVVGYKLAKPSLFYEVYETGRSQYIPFLITVLGIVFTDLLIGISLGLGTAVFHILWNNYKIAFKYNKTNLEEGNTVTMHLGEDLSFLNKASVQKFLNELPKDITLAIDASKTRNMHPDIKEIIKDFKINAMDRNITVLELGLEESIDKAPRKHFSVSK